MIKKDSFSNAQVSTEWSQMKKQIKRNQLVMTIFGILVAAFSVTFVAQFSKGYLKRTHAGFREFVAPDGSFIALLPQGVKETRKKIRTPIGPIETFTYHAKGKYHEFSIAYCDYTDSFIAETAPERIIDQARDGAVSTVKGQLLGETHIDWGGNPGRELKIKTQLKMILKSRIYLVGKRLFQVMALAKPDHADDKIAAGMFDSFKIRR